MNKTNQTLLAFGIAAAVALASLTTLCLALVPKSTADPVQVVSEQDGQEEVATDQATEESEGATEEQSAADAAAQRELYIATWAERIDAFNEGYPLGGYGRVFAEAAYDNNVDPRLSPAIARLESSSGSVCYYAYNAWGWGEDEYSNWDEAIRTNVSNLGSQYGYSMTSEGAARYNDDDSDAWLEQVESFMYEIWESDSL